MFMIRPVLLITSLLLLTGPVSAASFDIQQERPSVFGYSYVEGGLVTYNDRDLDGWFIDGSFEVAKNWNITALYTSYSGKTGNTEVDFSNVQIGAGYHFKWFFTNPQRSHYLLRDLDLMAQAGLEQTESETRIGAPFNQTASDTESGVYAGVKARKKMVEKVEVAAGLTYHTHYEGIFVFSVEGLYEVVKNLHIRLSSEHADNDPYVNFFDDDTLALSVRYNF